MSESKDLEVGSIGWFDLAVPNATEVRNFYKKVVGWKSSDVAMGGYNDYCMNLPGSGKTVAGVCHARGVNENLPPTWMIYITVKSAATSAKRCVAMGGSVLVEPKGLGGMGRYCVIRDPAGAVTALFEPARAKAKAKTKAKAKAVSKTTSKPRGKTTKATSKAKAKTKTTARAKSKKAAR
ncbi:MAG: VOC family protein [bacterium]